VSTIRDGIAASPGIAIGVARVLRADVPAVPHGVFVAAEDVEGEVERFLAARDHTRERLRVLQKETAERVGAVEARIFEPQILMLEDSELIDGTIAYIRENRLPAERAFELRVLEWEARWSHSAHPMLLDRLNDLADVEGRLIRELLGLPEPDPTPVAPGERVILVARDLTPSMTVQLDPDRVVGIATDAGTRTSHSAILARSRGIPAVVSLTDLSEHVRTGDELILDGRAGRVVVSPSDAEKAAYRERDFRTREWEQELLLLAHLDAITRDGVAVALRANLDLPSEAGGARAHGAEGVGLFRTEFLVVGRNTFPDEEEQYEAYRHVLTTFAGQPVIVRTYDLGGDKFPAFLNMPAEENPYLGWRAIRVSLDHPEMFRSQLRPLLRAAVHGDLRIMIPMVNEVAEITATRALIDESLAELRRAGLEAPESYRLGIMVETPAAAIAAPELARHADFFSIGSNDLVQYTLAVDRGNSRLARRYNPFHPSVVRLLHRIVRAGHEAGLEVSVCGELAGTPLGAFMLIGMGIDSLSVGPAALAEVKKVIRSVRREDAARGVAVALGATTADEVVDALEAELGEVLDLDLFTGSWRLSRPA
jgi:phosphotransferase system enzyme I (PtsI)